MDAFGFGLSLGLGKSMGVQHCTLIRHYTNSQTKWIVDQMAINHNLSILRKRKNSLNDRLIAKAPVSEVK